MFTENEFIFYFIHVYLLLHLSDAAVRGKIWEQGVGAGICGSPTITTSVGSVGSDGICKWGTLGEVWNIPE